MDLSSGERVDYLETEEIQWAMQESDISGISTMKMKQFYDLLNSRKTGKENYDRGLGGKETLTPREEEKRMRDGIENMFVAMNGKITENMEP